MERQNTELINHKETEKGALLSEEVIRPPEENPDKREFNSEEGFVEPATEVENVELETTKTLHDGRALNKAMKKICNFVSCNNPQSSSGENNNVGLIGDDRSVEGASQITNVCVSKNDDYYNMNHKRRGKAVIFNFNNFDEANENDVTNLELKPRKGSEKDKRDLAQCLEKLDFEVVTHDNLRRQCFDREITKIQQEDHSDADCLVIVIMTHGKRNTIYTSCGTLIPLNSIWNQFIANKCPSLASKPKIFIIQACRGTRYDHGMQINTVSGNHDSVPLANEIDSGCFSYVIPNLADFLIAFSCPLGYYSWRNADNGSWFIQSVCKIFNEHAYRNVEIHKLFRMVTHEVAFNYEICVNKGDYYEINKQVPSTTTNMPRDLVFKPKPYNKN